MEATASLEVSAANSGAMVANSGAMVANSAAMVANSAAMVTHRRQLRGCHARDCSYHRAFRC